MIQIPKIFIFYTKPLNVKLPIAMLSQEPGSLMNGPEAYGCF
jgi:hypothetical protein